MASGSGNKGKSVMGAETEDLIGRMAHEMANFENYAGYDTNADYGDGYDNIDTQYAGTQFPSPTPTPLRPPGRRSVSRPPTHPNVTSPQTNIEQGGTGKRKKTSWVWEYFTLAQTSTEPVLFEVTCGICRKSYSHVRNGGTGTMARHLKNDHNLGEGSGVPLSQAQISGFPGTTPGAGMFVYNRDKMIEEFSNYIVLEEKPFMMSESKNFESFVKGTLQPAYKLVPRNTLKERIRKRFSSLKFQLISDLSALSGRVSLTCDLWKSPFEEYFLGVTCHWVDSSWILQKRIIAFDVVEESHDGFMIKNMLVDCINSYKISQKIVSIGFDNATNNTKAIELLLGSGEIDVLDREFFHVRCVCHVLNLAVQDGLNNIHYAIRPIRSALRWLRMSDKNRREFKKQCKANNLPPRIFALDMPVRWGSTYKMLCDSYYYKDLITSLYNRQKGTDVLTQDMWDLSRQFCTLLEAFDRATTQLSYVYQPSIHTVVPLVTEIAVLLRSVSDDHPLYDCSMVMIDKLFKYFLEFPSLFAIAGILDPRYKLHMVSYLEQCHQSLGNDSTYAAVPDNLLRILRRLYDKYSMLYNTQTPPLTPNETQSNVPLSTKLFNKLVKGNRGIGSSSSGNKYNELDDYLYHTGFVDDVPHFDILEWWSTNKKKFPILQLIAKDVIACPPSTVAIESAFSAGRRVLDEKRASLAPSTIKMLILSKDWHMALKRMQDQAVIDDEDDIDQFVQLHFESSSASASDYSSSATEVTSDDE